MLLCKTIGSINFQMEFRNLLNFTISSLIISVFLIFVPYAYDVFAVLSVSVAVMKLAEWLMTCTRKFFLYKTVSPKNKAILITGCDSGFGNALARRMDELGYKVFAACLYPTGAGAKELLNNCSGNLSILPMDVTSDQSIEDAKVFIAKNLQENVLWAVVNNAGIGHAGEIDWTSVEELQQIHNVNAYGTLRVTKAFLPFIKKSKGRIVNNTSICGRFICPGYVGYCMSKSSAVALTTGLRIELAKWGVKAISIEAFFYSTPLTGTKATWALAEKTWKNAPQDIRDEYGEDYKQSFKGSVAKLLSRCNPKIYEVIDCFEDAITAEEPLSIYFPSDFLDKIGIKILQTLPNEISEGYQRNHLERGAKPAALMRRKK